MFRKKRVQPLIYLYISFFFESLTPQLRVTNRGNDSSTIHHFAWLGFLYALGRSFHWKSLFRGSCRFHRHPDSQNLEPLDWRQRFGGGLGTHPSLKKRNKLDSGALIEAASAFVLCCIIVFRSTGPAVNQHDGLCNVLPLLLRLNR